MSRSFENFFTRFTFPKLSMWKFITFRIYGSFCSNGTDAIMEWLNTGIGDTILERTIWFLKWTTLSPVLCGSTLDQVLQSNVVPPIHLCTWHGPKCILHSRLNLEYKRTMDILQKYYDPMSHPQSMSHKLWVNYA